jgi:COMPASS component SWD2
LAINSAAPLVAFDPQGLIFAVALNDRFIRLFDRSAYERGPFACFEIISNTSKSARWESISFSPDGKELLVSTNNDGCYFIDSFDGTVKGTIPGDERENHGHLLYPAWSPDAQWIARGRADGKVAIWNRSKIFEGLSTSATVELEGHTSYPGLVRFNPKYAILASACSNLALWQPAFRTDE